MQFKILNLTLYKMTFSKTNIKNFNEKKFNERNEIEYINYFKKIIIIKIFITYI